MTWSPCVGYIMSVSKLTWSQLDNAILIDTCIFTVDNTAGVPDTYKFKRPFLVLWCCC